VTAVPPAVRVDRARLAHARPGDRQRLASALDLASPAATGVAERALLLIPKMRVDRPLAHGVEGFANELIDRIRAAKVAARHGRPGAVPDICFFEDEVAVEVAIVRLWLAGERQPEGLCRAVPLADAPVMRWRRHLFADHRKLPRVISALAEAKLVAAWLARFTASELMAAADQLARAYGGALPAIAANGGASPKAVRRPPIPAADKPPGRPAAIVEAIVAARALTPDPAARVLLAIALVAARQPALVATRAFAAALAELSVAAVAPLARRAAAPRSGRDAMSPVPTKRPRPAALGTSPSPKADSARPAPISAPPPPVSLRSLTPPPPAANPVGGQPPEPPRSGASAMPAPGEAVAVASERAGLFFLLNIFLALGLYGDFTDPVRRVRGLSPFELLLLLGRHWLGPGLEADPVAPLLRSLAGLGPRERPGRHFEAPPWSVPADWLAPWPRGRPRTFSRRFGASRWHAGGFPIADRWRVPRSAAWLRRRWVACLALYVEARLMRAFAVESADDALAILLDRRGTIQIEPDRVEIMFALDAHPLAIRLAGLDRDPGWIPAAARSIGFRFA
jgi:hypothetical protein